MSTVVQTFAAPGERLPRWYTCSGGVLLILAVAGGVLIAVGACAEFVALLHSIRLLIGLQNIPTQIYGFSLVCVLLSLWLLIGPVFAYLRVGQAKKIEIICGFYSPDLIARYFEQFWRGRDDFGELVRQWRMGRPTISDDLACKIKLSFAKLFQEDFGLRVYLLPSILLTAVGFIVLFFGFAGGIALAEALLSSSKQAPITPLGLQLDLVSVAAVFGAFTWTVSDSITRNHQWTFHPSDLSWYALRLIIAVPLGQTIALLWHGVPASGAAASVSNGLLGAWTGAFLAFVISMFSLDSITRILSSVAVRAGGMASATPDERNDIIVKLPGVDEEKARALGAEGVTTIAQLIAVDPVHTSISTGLQFKYILGLIDTALLWRYFGTHLDALREFGFIGASQVLNFAEAQRPQEVVTRAQEVADAATALNKCNDAFLAAEAALKTALAAIGQPAPTVAEVQASLQQVSSQLADAQKSPDTERALLEPDQALLRAATACNDELVQAMASRDTATARLNDRKTALLVAAANHHNLVTAIATKISGSPEGIDNLINQLAEDPYADFIRRLAAPRATISWETVELRAS
jgi:hypothetical protein